MLYCWATARDNFGQNMYVTDKYYWNPNVSNQMLCFQLIPMLRMSEVYYIAAEAIFDKNPDEAKSYLSYVKRLRGVRDTDYSAVSRKDEFIELLVNDMRREFFGEGQMLYQYKRLNHTMPAMSSYHDPVLPTDENVVLPLPDSESNIN